MHAYVCVYMYRCMCVDVGGIYRYIQLKSDSHQLYYII